MRKKLPKSVFVNVGLLERTFFQALFVYLTNIAYQKRTTSQLPQIPTIK